MRRLPIALVVMLAGILGFQVAPVVAAPTTTVEITDVYNAVNAQEEWIQLYNQTNAPITLQGWKVCTSGACANLPTTTIAPFTLSKIRSTNLPGWPANGLDGAADMVGLVDDKGAPVDSMNWGDPNQGWANYNTFRDMLWNPGVKAPDPSANQSFFRMAIGNDTDKPTDWLTTSSRPVVVATATAVAPPAATATAPAAGAATATTAPGAGGGSGQAAPTATTAASGGTTGGVGGGTTGGTNNTGTTTPQTGGEFPILVAVVLVAALLAIRYARRSFAGRGSRG